MNNKKGFTLVELMVVIAIVAILAAVALPMYSTFKQKSRVGAALNSVQGIKTALQTWYDDNLTFADIGAQTLDKGAIVDANGTRIGAGLAEVPNCEYQVQAGTASAITVSFNWTAKCPTTVCNGTWTLTCDSTNDECTVTRTIGTANQLGLDKTD